MPPALLILNPAAGRGRGRRQAREVVGALTAAGFTCTVRETARSGDERTLARDGAGEGWERIIAVGGDGTVHHAANGLLEAGEHRSALGVIPIGTGNDFAKMVHMVVPIAEGARLLAAATVRIFDVGRAGDEYITNSCGIGFGPAVVASMAHFPRLRGFPLYVAGVYRTFFRYVPPTIELASTEYSVTGPMTMVEIAVGTTAGGGFKLTPDAVPDDGLLDVCVIHRISTFQFLRYVPRVMAGTHGRLPPVRLFRTTGIRLRTPGTPLTVHLDGELRTMTADMVDVSIQPARLRVLCATP